ncbi:MAG: GNAT family N-acetyltransferase [Kineosporiaceae bacterium]
MSEVWAVHRSIDEVDAGEWDAVVRGAGGSAFHTHAWLRAYEYAPPAPLHHVRHLTMRRDGELRVVAPLYEASDDPHYTGYGADYGFDHPILWTRMLVGHSWYSYYNGVCSLDPAPAIAPGLVEAMASVAGELGVPIYGFPGIPQDDPLCRELHGLGFGHVYTEATSRLVLPATFEDHLGAMTSKKRREFRRLAHKAEKLGAVVRTDLREGDVAAFARLVEDVCTRHGCPTVNPPHSLESVFAQLGGQARFLSLWHGETLLGGFVLMHVDDVLYAWIAGLDYDHHKEFGTYYALYWHTMELAWQLGVRRLEMGRSMYGFKVRMGLRTQPLVSMFRAANAEGEELLRTGLVALDDACRTRDRILTAYRDNGAEDPEALLGPLPSWAPASRGLPAPLERVSARA